MIGQIFGNISAAHFERGKFELVLVCTTRILEDVYYQKDIKRINSIYLRRAEAYSKLNEFEQALTDLDKLSDPNDSEIKRKEKIGHIVLKKQKPRISKIVSGLNGVVSQLSLKILKKERRCQII